MSLEAIQLKNFIFFLFVAGATVGNTGLGLGGAGVGDKDTDADAFTVLLGQKFAKILLGALGNFDIANQLLLGHMLYLTNLVVYSSS